MAAEDGRGRAARPGAIRQPGRAPPLAGRPQPLDPARRPAHRGKVAPDIAYRRLKYVSDWRLVEENQRAALAAIVHGISRHDAAGHWGDGTTSASDGQRFAMPQKVLQRTYSTRFNDFALEFYSFVADNYAPFYSRPVECTDRDAPFVLDDVLYHESDLDLEEHYTDTHGYTEINFAAFGMVGMRFCPRIRSLHRQRIYCADPDRDHGVLEPVLKRGRRAVNFRLIAEQWDRIGQFYAAFPAGHATASAALQRLNRFQASNRFYAANRELGRALKTEFVLQYMSEPQLRAKVRRGLLKVEQLHALARAVYYGQRGRISAREVSPASSTGRPGRSHGWPPRRTSRSTPICCGMSARSSGRTSSSTARSRSTPPSSRCDALSVYHNTNGVGTLVRPGRGTGSRRPGGSACTPSGTPFRAARPPGPATRTSGAAFPETPPRASAESPG